MNTNTIKAAAAIPVVFFRVTRRLYRRVAKPVRLWLLAKQEQHAEDHISDLVAMSQAIPKDIIRMHRVTVQLAAKRMAIERNLA